VVILPITTLMQRVLPRGFLDAGTLLLDRGDTLDPKATRERLELAGYRCVTTVMEHGEFAVRGGIFDLFPMGSKTPYRIELFDDEVESIRSFDPETQRSLEKVDTIRLLPAREFPLDDPARERFRERWLASFDDHTTASPIYRDVRRSIAPPGVEYYLPLFFEHTATLFDYLPEQTLVAYTDGVQARADEFWREIGGRYDNLRHNPDRPCLPPMELYLQPNEVFAATKAFPRIELVADSRPASAAVSDFATTAPPALTIDARHKQPLRALSEFIDEFPGRVLLAAETAGRREALQDLLRGAGIKARPLAGWNNFVAGKTRLGITIAPLEQGLVLNHSGAKRTPLAVIAEPQLFGEQAMQRRQRKKSTRDPDAVVRNLTELNIGSPVVHEDYGVGRYLGLQSLDVGVVATEFLTLTYHGGE
jgi:transcription-repair coupling factor (superfamily II helicase)